MAPLEVYAIPFQDLFVVYRPLTHLAFVANRAMADIALAVARGERTDEEYPEVSAYLAAVGFFVPDPPHPPEPPKRYRPTTAALLLTNRCNLKCVYCYARGGQGSPVDLDAERACLAVETVAQNAAAPRRAVAEFELVLHGGGEPLCNWPTLTAAVACARRQALPCRVSLCSNGLWSAPQTEWLLEHVDTFTLSFDGIREVQETQRPAVGAGGSFRPVLETVRRLDEARKPYGIRMTVTSQYLDRLPESVRFLAENTECRRIQVEPSFALSGATGVAEGDRFVVQFLEAMDAGAESGVDVVYSGARPWLATSMFCSAPFDALVVAPDGKLVSCYEVTHNDHALAPMLQVGHLERGGPVVDELRLAALWTHLRERRAECRDCFCYWHCAGDCLARTLGSQNLSTDATDPDANPRCRVNRAITLEMILRRQAFAANSSTTAVSD